MYDPLELARQTARIVCRGTDAQVLLLPAGPF